jgi:hypothetical protein
LLRIDFVEWIRMTMREVSARDCRNDGEGMDDLHVE